MDALVIVGLMATLLIIAIIVSIVVFIGIQLIITVINKVDDYFWK